MGMRLANGNWSDALADTPQNQAQYGAGSGYQGSAGYGSPQYGTGGGSGGGGSNSSGSSYDSGGSSGSGGGNLDQQFQKLLQALASGNKQAFDEAKIEFNQKFDEAKREYDLGRGDSLDQFAQTFGLSSAALTGMYNGQPTLAGQGQAQQNAIGVANLTGYYTPPGQTGGGGSGGGMPAAADFSKLSAADQQPYLQYHGANAAADWAKDAGAAVQSFQAAHPGAQSWQLGNATGQFGTPSQGGQGQPGQGIQTLAGNQQQFNQQLQTAQQQLAQQVQLGYLTNAQAQQKLAELSNSQQFGLSQAGVTGQYNGSPTEAARQFNITSGQQGARDQASLGTSLLNAATQIRGPRDYLQYQQLTHGGQDLMQQLYGNQDIPQSGAPTGQLRSANLQSVLGDMGWNPQSTANPGNRPGGNMSMESGGMGTFDNPARAGIMGAPTGQLGADFQAPGRPTANYAGPNPAAGQVDPTAQLLQRFGMQSAQPQLNPNQIDPARWDAMGQIGQDLTKNLAETSYGYDAQDFENRINKTRPMGTASRQTTTGYAAPRGIF